MAGATSARLHPPPPYGAPAVAPPMAGATSARLHPPPPYGSAPTVAPPMAGATFARLHPPPPYGAPAVAPPMAGATSAPLHPPPPYGAPAVAPPSRSPSSLKRPADAATTINSLNDENIEEILLALPSAASLFPVVSAHDNGHDVNNWRKVASSPEFLCSFRQRHPLSPFIGLFAWEDGHWKDGYDGVAWPLYQPARISDPDIAAVERKGDFTLSCLHDSRSLRLQDCRNGLLLLSLSDNSLCVYNPVSEWRVQLPHHLDDGTTDEQCLTYCLLTGGGTSSVQQSVEQAAVPFSFRVVSLQQQTRKIRAVVYDSNNGEWRRHPWVSPQTGGKKGLLKLGMNTRAMYANGNIFWRCAQQSLVLVLEICTMDFSLRTLPPDLSFGVSLRYAIGEIEDGKGYLVCLTGLTYEETPTLEVWALDMEMWKADLLNNASWKLQSEKWWKRKKKIHVSQLLGESALVREVSMVVNGLALICMNHRYTQFVVDLNSMSLLGKFRFRGRGYPYQMSWPPVGLAATSVVSTPALKETRTEEMLSTSEGSRGRKRRCSRNLDNYRATSVCLVQLPSSRNLLEVNIERDGEHSKLSLNNRMEEPPTLSCSEPTCLSECNTSKRQANHQPVADNPKDGEPGGQRAKLKTNACPEDQHVPSPSRESAQIPGNNNDDREATSAGGLESDIAAVSPEGEESESRSRTKRTSLRSESQAIRLGTKPSNEEYSVNNRDGQEGTSSGALEPGNKHKNQSSPHLEEISNPGFKVHGDDDHEASNLRKYHDGAVLRSGSGQFPEMESLGSTPSVETLLDSNDKDGSHLIRGIQTPLVSTEASHPKRARTRSNHAVNDISRIEAEKTFTPVVPQSKPTATSRNGSMRRLIAQKKSLCEGSSPVQKNLFTCHEVDSAKGHDYSCSYENCKRGNKPFANSYKLKRHISESHKEKSFECSYENCKRGNKPFANSYKLKRHISESHKEKSFECATCHKKFPRELSLADHVERFHGWRGTPFTCGFIGCSKTLASRHEKKKHEESKIHIEVSTGRIRCLFKDCTKTFTRKHNVLKHYKKHEQRQVSSED